MKRFQIPGRQRRKPSHKPKTNNDNKKRKKMLETRQKMYLKNGAKLWIIPSLWLVSSCNKNMYHHPLSKKHIQHEKK